MTRRVVDLFTPYRSRLILIAVAIVVSAGLGVLTPFLTQAVFDDALFGPGGPRVARTFRCCPPWSRPWSSSRWSRR